MFFDFLIAKINWQDMSTIDVLLLVSFCGLIVVFAMIIILVIFIKSFGVSIKMKNNKKKVTPCISNTLNQNYSTTALDIIDDEIIAVISAAVYAMYEGSGKTPVIRLVRKTGSRSAWATAGIINNTKAF